MPILATRNTVQAVVDYISSSDLERSNSELKASVIDDVLSDQVDIFAPLWPDISALGRTTDSSGAVQILIDGGDESVDPTDGSIDWVEEVRLTSQNHIALGSVFLGVTDADGFQLEVVTSDGNSFSIISPDGVSQALDSDVSVTVPLGSNYTGNVELEFSENQAPVEIVSTSGEWSFDIGAIDNRGSQLTYLNILSATNTIYGSLESYFRKFFNSTYVRVEGNNEIEGDLDVAFMHASSLASFFMIGNNRLRGALDKAFRHIPEIGTFRVQGHNTTIGDMAVAFRFTPKLRTYWNSGHNTTHGDISTMISLVPLLVYFEAEGANYHTCLSVPQFNSTMRNFVCNGSGLDESSVDNILAGLEGVVTWTNEKLVDLSGPYNSAPSAAGLASKAIIEANGATVQVVE